MDEPARRKRNSDKLAECFPVFRDRMQFVISALEDQRFRPRIQEAWRSPEDQLKAFETGHSKLKFGFHNATGENGRKEALAVDLLDDDAPLAPSTRYLIALAIAAQAQRLETGLAWGLPARLREGVAAAIAQGDIEAPIKVGWDPCHVQVSGIAVADVRRGERPT